MKLSETVMPISEVKARASELIDELQNSRKPVLITQNGCPKAIVQDLESFEETQESLAMLKIIAQGREALRGGKVRPMSRAFADIRTQIAARRAA